MVKSAFVIRILFPSLFIRRTQWPNRFNSSACSLTKKNISQLIKTQNSIILSTIVSSLFFYLKKRSNRETEIEEKEKASRKATMNNCMWWWIIWFSCKHKVKRRAIKFSQTLLFCVLLSTLLLNVWFVLSRLRGFSGEMNSFLSFSSLVYKQKRWR